MNTRLNTNMSRIVHQTQDFLTYNETDGKVGVAPTQITLTDGDRDEDYYVTRDFGAGYFGDFTHWVDVNVTALTNHANSGFIFWGLADTSDDFVDIDLANGSAIFIFAIRSVADTHYKIQMYDLDKGTLALKDTSSDIAVGAEVFTKVIRSGSTISCELYSTDALRVAGGAGDIDTIGVATFVTDSFRYVYALGSLNNGGGGYDVSGTVSNLLVEGVLQNFKGYSVTSTLSKVTSATRTITLTAGDRDEDYYVTKDLGAGNIGDFTHKVDVNVSAITDAAGSDMVPYGLANASDDFNDISGASGDAIFLSMARNDATSWKLKIFKVTGGSTSLIDTSVAITVGDTAYLSINRTGTTMTVGIYSTSALRSAAGAADMDTITGTVVNTAFRYVYGLGSFNDGGTAKDVTGTVSNLTII